ncbi:hypothetical protein D3C81_1588980 [compost metagenome]
MNGAIQLVQFVVVNPHLGQHHPEIIREAGVILGRLGQTLQGTDNIISEKAGTAADKRGQAGNFHTRSREGLHPLPEHMDWRTFKVNGFCKIIRPLQSRRSGVSLQLNGPCRLSLPCQHR